MSSLNSNKFRVEQSFNKIPMREKCFCPQGMFLSPSNILAQMAGLEGHLMNKNLISSSRKWHESNNSQPKLDFWQVPHSQASEFSGKPRLEKSTLLLRKTGQKSEKWSSGAYDRRVRCAANDVRWNEYDMARGIVCWGLKKIQKGEYATENAVKLCHNHFMQSFLGVKKKSLPCPVKLMNFGSRVPTVNHESVTHEPGARHDACAWCKQTNSPDRTRMQTRGN